MSKPHLKSSLELLTVANNTGDTCAGCNKCPVLLRTPRGLGSLNLLEAAYDPLHKKDNLYFFKRDYLSGTLSERIAMADLQASEHNAVPFFVYQSGVFAGLGYDLDTLRSCAVERHGESHLAIFSFPYRELLQSELDSESPRLFHAEGKVRLARFNPFAYALHANHEAYVQDHQVASSLFHSNYLRYVDGRFSGFETSMDAFTSYLPEFRASGEDLSSVAIFSPRKS